MTLTTKKDYNTNNNKTTMIITKEKQTMTLTKNLTITVTKTHDYDIKSITAVIQPWNFDCNNLDTNINPDKNIKTIPHVDHQQVELSQNGYFQLPCETLTFLMVLSHPLICLP